MSKPKYRWRADGHPDGHMSFCASPHHNSVTTWCSASPDEPQTLEGQPSKAFVEDHREERHDDDGKPYLAYFRNDLIMGFVWSGFFRDPVQVTREMGEPVIATFPLDDLPPAMSPTDLLQQFQRACDAWAESNVATELFGLPITPALIVTESYGTSADGRQIAPGLIVFTNEMRVGKVEERGGGDPEWFTVRYRNGGGVLQNAERVATRFEQRKAEDVYLYGHDWVYRSGEGECTLCGTQREGSDGRCPSAPASREDDRIVRKHGEEG